MNLFLCIILFPVGLAAIIIEFFVPAAGIIGIVGIGSIIGGIILAYINYGTTIGTIYLLSALIIVPVVVIFYFRRFPESFMGKRLILHDSQKQKDGFTSYTEDKYSSLINKNGESLTTLRPAGSVKIENKKYSVVTSGEFIDKGQNVKVVKIEGSRIIVREGE